MSLSIAISKKPVADAPLKKPAAGKQAARKRFKDLETFSLREIMVFQRQNPHFTQAELDRLGEYVFNAMAIQRGDVSAWSAAQQIRLKWQDFWLKKKVAKSNARKMELESRRSCQQLEKGTGGGEGKAMTLEEKDAAMKQILGIK